ncbi:MAG: hypothetical protein O7C58_00315 [Rickettsia endosymbiont of Ixodes persulcatus]|nr:hypothetical protein [Rickettsia endosymbiont of Ixodes persulcatus]MCZ6902706.1 hypothetical protein [Rickettsia endosymbiont of Ixodes persulcatus]MCZ6920222.1 hypothetical protein [Rickettsia endosymbiont of Ixodes persulcatus]MCZ6924121.1 hypothetical protein [Rickettsia endosymbiont of Ixodes persulcatus]
MTGIAKNPATGYFPLEIMKHIASYLKFSDITFINEELSDDWVLL